MNWNQQLSRTEYWFIAIFCLLYLLYFARIFWIAYQLKTTARAATLKFFLRIGYFGLIIMALLDPSFGEMQGTIKAEGKDILLVVDISKSMDATDIQPTRLEKIKFELARFITNFKSDRIGLIAFKGEAVMESPLTFDQNALNLFISTLNTNLIPDSGTDLMEALDLAISKLTSSQNSRNKAKVIVLISDGEDFGSFDSRLLYRITRSGIHVLTVGIGTLQGSKFKVDGKFAQNGSGNDIISRFNPENLQKIAIETRGSFFKINDKENNFPELVDAIQQMKGELIDERQVLIGANKYYYFIISALVLLVLDVLITVKTLQV